MAQLICDMYSWYQIPGYSHFMGHAMLFGGWKRQHCDCLVFVHYQNGGGQTCNLQIHTCFSQSTVLNYPKGLHPIAYGGRGLSHTIRLLAVTLKPLELWLPNIVICCFYLFATLWQKKFSRIGSPVGLLQSFFKREVTKSFWEMTWRDMKIFLFVKNGLRGVQFWVRKTLFDLNRFWGKEGKYRNSISRSGVKGQFHDVISPRIEQLIFWNFAFLPILTP